MNALTHALITRCLVGKGLDVFLASIGPDAPFYATYVPWVIARRKAVHSLMTSEWDDPPEWMLTAHHAAHSLSVALAAATLVRCLRGKWPRRALLAWCLHIAIDIPLHSRRFWGPRFLWPLSEYAVDGVPWAEITSHALAALLSRFQGL